MPGNLARIEVARDRRLYFDHFLQPFGGRQKTIIFLKNIMVHLQQFNLSRSAQALKMNGRMQKSQPSFYHFLLFFLVVICSAHANGQSQAEKALSAKMESMITPEMKKVIAWRRDFHQHPELSNREFRTAKEITGFLSSLGLQVQTGVAKTGVVALLVGGRPGPVVALRADMDALPVTERGTLSFRSRDSVDYNGRKTGVMHACGHDTHVAMLMGAAEILSAMKSELKGTVKFIFQPAEEGPPSGEEGGAKMMVKEAVLENPKVDVIFGQHISSGNRVGVFTYRSGSVSAENDIFRIVVKGRQSHGASPWSGIDPIVVASQIVTALQTIVSRNLPLTTQPAVITVGSFHSGNRENIIPEEAVLTGTIRTLDSNMRNTIHSRMRELVTRMAESAGATAEINISMEDAMLVNDPALTAQMIPVLKRLAGDSGLVEVNAGMGAEDFAYFAQKVPGFYFQTGALPAGKKSSEVLHHTPDFQIDEQGMEWGLRAIVLLTINYMESHESTRKN